MKEKRFDVFVLDPRSNYVAFISPICLPYQNSGWPSVLFLRMLNLNANTRKLWVEAASIIVLNTSLLIFTKTPLWDSFSSSKFPLFFKAITRAVSIGRSINKKKVDMMTCSCRCSSEAKLLFVDHSNYLHRHPKWPTAIRLLTVWVNGLSLQSVQAYIENKKNAIQQYILWNNIFDIANNWYGNACICRTNFSLHWLDN